MVAFDMGKYAEYPDEYLNSQGQPADHPGSVAEVDQKISYVGEVLNELRDELFKAMTKHAPMHSPHEGISVIREEVDELWDHVKADTGRTPDARKEAKQIAAMAIRYIVDLIDAS